VETNEVVYNLVAELRDEERQVEVVARNSLLVDQINKNPSKPKSWNLVVEKERRNTRGRRRREGQAPSKNRDVGGI
jgi:hypothetical protein